MSRTIFVDLKFFLKKNGKSIAEYIRGRENHGLHVGDYTIRARYNL